MNKVLLFFLVAVFNLTCSNEKQAIVKTDPQQAQNEKLFPYEDYFLDKQFPITSFSYDAYQNALKNVAIWKSKSSNRSNGSWQVQGPGNIGARVNTVAVHPTNSNIILAGFSEGGVFKTMNGGQSWYPVFDNQTKLSIGDITYNPQNPNIVYVGTGDPNISGYPFTGNGLFKSIDGGESWTYSGLQETGIISQIRVSEKNPDIIYASSTGLPFIKTQERGVYKSADGGNTWQKILFVNDSTGIIDLALDPRDDKVLYAVSWSRVRNNNLSITSSTDGKIYKTIDGGINWKILEGGLPAGEVSRIGIDICKSQPDVLYATYTHHSTYNLEDIYTTNDGGANWDKLPIYASNRPISQNLYGGFGWYFGKVKVNPQNPDDLFVLGVDCYRSRNGGDTWELATPPWWTYEVHADKHDLVFTDTEVILATDGGLYATDIDQSDEWRDIENIPTTQFYRVAYNPHNPDFYYGGAQDNGTTGGNASGIDQWERIFGGDGFQMVFHPDVPEVFYVSSQNGSIRVTEDGGQSFDSGTNGIDSDDPRNWDMPYMLSAHHTERLYTGTNRVYRSQGPYVPSWQSISPVLTDSLSPALRKNISALHESPVNEDYIYAGTSDGLLWGTNNFGSTWEKINAGLPVKYVTSVQASPDNAEAVFVSFSGYRDFDNTAYIYKSSDNGKNWVNIQGDMPLISINSIFVLPGYNDRVLFVATDAGVFYTKNRGLNWQVLGDNLPSVAVYHLGYNVQKNELVAGTYGRSIQSFALDQLDLSTSTNQTIFSPSLTVTPSLASTEITLALSSLPKSKKINGYVMNANGSIVSEFNMSGLTKNMNISNLPNGTYFICLYSEDGVIAKKIVKN